MSAALSVEDLVVEVGPPGGARRAVDRLSLELRPGRLLALVGPSGAGKSLVAQALLALPPAGARIAGGRVALRGHDLLRMRPRELRRARGGGIALIPQHPAAALTPTRTVGSQIAEVVRLHRGAGRAEARSEAVGWLERLGIPEPAVRAGHHPHRLSGGQRQRVAVALALAGGPAVLVADEPTAALDPPLTVALMGLLAGRRDAGLAVLVISHDLGAVAGVADEVAVIDGGALVEHGPAGTVLAAPRHPATAALVAAART